MSTSTLDLDNLLPPDRVLGRGHGTDSLGPSDTSDSGSDVAGGPSKEDANLATPEGMEIGRKAHDSRRGKIDLDSDTDSTGTGERASVEQGDEVRDGQDIGVDRIEEVALDELFGDDRDLRDFDDLDDAEDGGPARR